MMRGTLGFLYRGMRDIMGSLYRGMKRWLKDTMGPLHKQRDGGMAE